MTLHLYQIIVAIVAGLMIYQGISNFISRRGNQTFLKVFVRIFIWSGIALVALFPSATNFLAKIIGMQGNINAVILTGFLLIFLIIFKLLSAIEKLEQQLTELIKKDALKDIFRSHHNEN